MHWFRKQAHYKICISCGTLFDPTKIESCEPWDDLCYEHRKSHIETARRKCLVIDWANKNWAKLEEQALKERAEQSTNQQPMLQHRPKK